jgi:prepilin-type N-terminal cleavage/methylation domain-containing protein/prepilin-type processing-associated H-X9-DG protein
MTRKAFTLIELLVVIAIIALLLAILVPSLSAIKEYASIASCLTNQKNIATAFTVYCIENDDSMCSGYVYDDLNTREAPSWVKAPLVYNAGGYSLASDPELNTETRLNGLREGAIYPYLEATDVFHCPGDRRLKKGASRYFTDNPPDPINVYQAYRSYGMPDFYVVNGDENGVPNEKKLANITAPGSKLLFVEDQYDKWYNIDAWSYQPTYRVYWDPLGNYHNKSCTFAFADSHAEYYKWRDPRSILFMGNRVLAAAQGYGKNDVQDNPFNADHDWLDRHYPYKTRFKGGQ